LGPVKIVQKTDDRVVFARLDGAFAHQPAGGEFRIAASGQNRTRVEWDVELLDAFRRHRRVKIVRVVGLVGLIGVGGVMSTYVALFPQPFIQTRLLEPLWFVHAFLWSPFLQGWLSRQGVQRMRTQIDALANNLPYLNPTSGGSHP
jgi:hypothetical protein